MKPVLLVIVLIFCSFSRTFGAFKRVCYYSATNKTDQDIPVSKINGTLCTHLIVGFASVANNSIVPTRGDNDTKVYLEAVKLKKMYPELFVMVSVGGGGDSIGFHEAVSNHNSRHEFTHSIISLLAEYDFDGLDIDWEFPAWSKHDEDRDNFVHLLNVLRQEFDFASRNRTNKLVLSAAVSPHLTIITVSYNIAEMSKYVDFINLMSYDYHDYSPYFPFVEFNAPLFSRSSELGHLATYNTNWSANYWISNGCPREKLVIGIPTYSHNYILAYDKNWTPGSAAICDAPEMTYGEVCSWLADPSTIYKFDGQAGVPYAFNGHLWSSFEDRTSIRKKAEWIKNSKFGGAMTFSLNCDDFQFRCSNVYLPLHTIVHDVLTHE